MKTVIKKMFSILMLLLLAVAHAEAPSLEEQSGLAALRAALVQGMAVTAVDYASGTKLAREFTVMDEAEIDRLLQALEALQIVGTTEERITDINPTVTFRLADGGSCTLAFNGRWLQAQGVNCELSGDEAFRSLLSELADRYAPVVPAALPNSVDLYLPANPTTGYGWSWAVDAEGIVAITELYMPDPAEPGLAGAGGTHWFHLDGLQAGTVTVALTYSRPWEEGSAVSALTLRVTVDDALNVLIWGIEKGGTL